MRQHGEIERRWRRGGGPFERPSIPGVAGLVAQLFAAANADDELGDLKPDAAHDECRTAGGHDQPRTPYRHVVVLHPPGHTEQAEDIKRHKGDVEADQPTPERRLTKPFVKPEAERLWKPVGVAGERTEQHAADNDVVE